MKQIAIVDRFEGDFIIVEIENTKEMVQISRNMAPPMLGEGMIVDIEDNRITGIDFEETERREDELRRRFERILGKKD